MIDISNAVYIMNITYNDLFVMITNGSYYNCHGERYLLSQSQSGKKG